MTPRRTRAKDLRRRVASRRERRTIVVFCEGEASEPDYLNALKRLPEIRNDTSVRVEIDPAHGVPLTLVKLAVLRSKEQEIDECWCVFDVEWPQQRIDATRYMPRRAWAADRAAALAQRHAGNQTAFPKDNPSSGMYLLLAAIAPERGQ